ncbi:centromere protein N isoform X3 [Pseudophryne corroboree]|uniref:centromere protein N isoform X3 n=1 Tax=Pseudophryne corroboree TaxID=495146 RepID=UPI00308184B2
MAPTPKSAQNSRQLQSIPAMDEWVAEFIKRLVQRMSAAESMNILKAWGFLTERELSALTVRHSKENLALQVLDICESRKATIRHAADLDIIYTHANTKKKTWDVYQMSMPPDPEMGLVDVSELKEKFKKTIHAAMKNALLCAAGYSQIQQMDLKCRCLESLKDIVFKRFNQPFQSYLSRSQQEIKVTPAVVDQRVTYENMKDKERINQLTRETFGDGSLPNLEFATYKLETSFKGESGISNAIEPFRCVVKFSSPHLLESIRSLGPAGISETPVSSLLSCIPHRARNIYKIAEKKPLPPTNNCPTI